MWDLSRWQASSAYAPSFALYASGPLVPGYPLGAPTPTAAFLSMTPLLLYCSLVGWKVSTLRAAIMAICYLLALILSRPRELLQAVVLAAATILLLDPNALFSLGFQLSFVAVTMIILTSRALPPPTFPGLPGWGRALYSSGVATSAAFIGTIPLLASAFHTIPIYSPLANVILLPLISLLVPVGLIILALTMLWPTLAPLALTSLTWPLNLLATTTHYIASRPEALYQMASLPATATLGYYGLIASFFMLRRPGQHLSKRFKWSLCVLFASLLLGATGWEHLTSQPRQLRVTFLDVGTGDAILIQTPSGHNLLVDGGGTYNGQFDIGTRVVAPVLWQYHIDHFDLMAITHMHPNHARGLASVMRLFHTQHLLTNGSPLDADYLHDLSILAHQRNIRRHTASAGPRHWQWGRLHLTVLSPPPQSAAQSWQPPTENDRSLVLRLQYGNLRILLTGDIHHATELWLTQHIKDLRADILQIPHHGSRTSTHPEFIQRVQPRVGVITAGSGNPYGHPHPGVLATLAQHHVRVFRTDRHGAITITSDGTTYDVRPFIAPHPASAIRSAHIPPLP